MARQFESLAVWRRVSHEGVGRLGQACVYSISGETQSRHCWWLMLAVSLAHSMSGDATAGHSRTVASSLAGGEAVPVGAERHTDHRAGVAGERGAEGLAGVGVPQPHRAVGAGGGQPRARRG